MAPVTGSAAPDPGADHPGEEREFADFPSMTAGPGQHAAAGDMSHVSWGFPPRLKGLSRPWAQPSNRAILAGMPRAAGLSCNARALMHHVPAPLHMRCNTASLPKADSGTQVPGGEEDSGRHRSENHAASPARPCLTCSGSRRPPHAPARRAVALSAARGHPSVLRRHASRTQRTDEKKGAARRRPPRSFRIGPARGAAQRFENWKDRRALRLPYFFRSTTRASRVRKPAFFRGGRSEGS